MKPESNATHSELLPARAVQAQARQAYARQSRPALEEQWILKHLPLVRHIANRISSQIQRSVDLDELISAGTLGLVEAARAFDPGKDAAFRTYAYIRIRGAILDELRSRSFVSPAVHAQIRTVKEAYQKLLALRGDPPSDEDLSAELGISQSQLYRTLGEARRQHFLSIHGLNDEEPSLGSLLPREDGPGPEEQAVRKEMAERLAAAILKLPQKDRHVLLLYYEQDLTMKEIAKVLGVTESRVCQIHSSAVFRLSMMLGANDEHGLRELHQPAGAERGDPSPASGE